MGRVLVEDVDRIRVITLNRPERKNALLLEMYDAMTAALVEAAELPSIRVVLFRGEGGAFTAGNDLADFMQRPPTDMDSPVMRFLSTLVGFPKPVIAAVDGAAVGIGTTMLLHCDLAFASTRAFFSLPFVQLGLVPEAASSLLLPALVGHRRAFELLTLGDRFDGATAERLGIVNAVVEPDALDGTARAAAERLARLAPAAVRETKRLMRGRDLDAVKGALAEEAAVFVGRLASPEAGEAMTAFFEKRAPDFSRFD
jgi:enoyl-CoA hydratase/carnithine racemase